MRLTALFLFLFQITFGQTVTELNTTQYLGRWYQVYSDLAVELSFENNSLCDTADYGINPNGTISVLNRERQYSTDGPERIIYGWADVANQSEPGQLFVNLQTVPLPAPYWVYQLGPATYNGSMYEYSIVSDPLKLTLFVLARNVTTFMANWSATVMSTLTNLGFTNILNIPILTPQTNCTYW